MDIIMTVIYAIITILIVLFLCAFILIMSTISVYWNRMSRDDEYPDPYENDY